MTASDDLFLFALRVATTVGSVAVETPDGRRRTVGAGPPEATLLVRNRGVYGRMLRGGVLGFADAYIDGDIDVDDLGAFVDWGARNHVGRTTGPLAAVLTPIRRAWQRLAATTGHARVTTMVEHYDLGNDFYAAWLDPTMTYSSGRFTLPDTTLEEAQRAKYGRITQLAGLRPGMRVFEIGCGWGGFAEHAAAEHDVDVVCVTLSNAQARYARKRVADAGLTGRVDIRVCDFGEVQGTFDAVVSIEMIESVDESVWPRLFRSIHGSLADGAPAVLQSITISDDRFAGYRRRHDFIQRYIFPGGQVPSPAVLTRLGDEAGLRTTAVETFGLDYARTLDEWALRFEAVWGTSATAALDERFRRMWRLYLTYCAAGFRTGTIDVQQRVYRRTA